MRIDKVDVVAAFKVDQSAPLKLGAALAAVAENCKVPVTPISVPSAAPPHIPRFLVGIQQTLLQVALDRIQLTITPPDHIQGSEEEVFGFVRSEVQRLLAPLASQHWMEDQWAGVIAELRFPTDDESGIKAAAQAASAITSLDWATDGLKVFQLQIGRQVNNFFRTFTVSGYEKRTANLQLQPGQTMISLDALDSKLEEAGITVTLDINNRAMPAPPTHGVGLSDVIGEVEKALQTLPKELNLQGVLV